MIDNWGRKIDYLRISLTDRCNLRCIYCMPKEGIKYTSEEDLLSLEEILKISKLAAELGISKIRITGGEPLVRQGVPAIIKELKAIPGIKEVCLTTNGIFLEEKIEELTEAGLDKINISLDTMKVKQYKDITLYGDLRKVMKGIDLSITKGIKVKLNTVIMEGVNDGEIMDFVKLTETKPVDVRFIELMPIGEGKKFSSFKGDKIKEIISWERSLICYEIGSAQDGPAEYYKTENGLGRIGFISAVSHSFCDDCNRIRLTCKGFFKQCLFLNTGIDLKSLIRGGTSDEELKKIMEAAIKGKPKNPLKGDLLFSKGRASDEEAENWKDSLLEDKFMSEIGG